MYGATSESSTPASAAMVIGLRVTLRNPVSSDGRRPLRSASSRASEIGVMTSSWSSSVGAISEMSPST